MISRGIYIAILATIGLYGYSCDSHKEVASRYRLEKELWKAELLSRGINPVTMRNSREEIGLAISAYERLLEKNPLKELSGRRWDPLVMSDIRRILTNSKLAVAKLYFLEDKLFFAGELYEMDGNLKPVYEIPNAWDFGYRLYRVGAGDEIEFQCENIFKNIIEEGGIWTNDIILDKSFLDIPLVLAGVYKRCGNEQKYREYCEIADDLYASAIAYRPDSRTAELARINRVELNVLRGNWDRALRGIRSMLNAGIAGWGSRDLELMLGKIILRRGDDYEAADDVFRGITRRYPDSKAGYEAMLLSAWILLNTGERKGGMTMIEKVERSNRAPDEVRSKALLWMALEYSKEGRWEQAQIRLKRILRIFPESPSALEAPLLLVLHYIEAGHRAAAMRELIKARSFYLSVIEEEKVSPARRLAAENRLIECHLMFDNALEAASLLAGKFRNIPWPGDAGAVLRSAVIFLAGSSTRDEAGKLLKKCIALYPKTMYAKRAEAILNITGLN